MNERMRDGIVQRGSTWSYVVRVKDPATGLSKPRWVGGFVTRTAAKASRDGTRHAVNRGTYVAPQDLTLLAWLERWLEGHAVRLKPATEASYRGIVARYLAPGKPAADLGAERLQSLAPSRLSAVYRRLAESGGQKGKPLSRQTVVYLHSVIRKSLSDAVVERLLEVNPAAGAKLSKRGLDDSREVTAWAAADLRGFLEHAVVARDRLYPLYVLVAHTGMRRGEALALRWSDIDLDAGTVRVRRAVVQIGTQLTYGLPKNHEQRHVKISARVVDSLRAWRKAQAAERLAWGPAYQPTDLLFTWEDGRLVQPDYVTKAFVRLVATTGAPRLTFHGLRHTHATLLLRDRWPVHVVAKRLGHKDPTITLTVYAHAIPDDDVELAGAFDRAVYGA